MSSQTDAMKRLEAIEAQNRVDKQGPHLERLAAATGISVGEILSEASRVEAATSNLTHHERIGWIAADCGLTIDELLAEADALLADDPDL
jgi:transcriptional regulator with XRE-family HTH domain